MTLLTTPAGFALRLDTGEIILRDGERAFSLEEAEEMLDAWDLVNHGSAGK